MWQEKAYRARAVAVKTRIETTDGKDDGDVAHQRLCIVTRQAFSLVLSRAGGGAVFQKSAKVLKDNEKGIFPFPAPETFACIVHSLFSLFPSLPNVRTSVIACVCVSGQLLIADR